MGGALLKGAIIAEGVDVFFSFHEVEAGEAKRGHVGLFDADSHGIRIDGFAERFRELLGETLAQLHHLLDLVAYNRFGVLEVESLDVVAVVEIDRLMGSVEAADTDVHDADAERAAVIPGDQDPRIKLAEGLCGKLDATLGFVLACHVHHPTPTRTQMKEGQSAWLCLC